MCRDQSREFGGGYGGLVSRLTSGYRLQFSERSNHNSALQKLFAFCEALAQDFSLNKNYITSNCLWNNK